MNRRFIRRNRVDERTALSIAAGSGIAAALAGARPTGSVVVDTLLVAVSVGAVVWASASAQWWASAAVAGVAAAVAIDPLATSIGALAFLGGLNVGTWRRDQTAMRALIGGIAMNVLIRSQLEGFHGLSAIVAIAVAVALFVLGVLRRPSRIRRRSLVGVGAAGAFAVLALLAVGVSALSARPDITDGARTARQGITALNAGEYVRAAGLFEQASVRFEQADGGLGGILAAPGRLLPAIAQNLNAGADLSGAAADATAEAAAALRRIDPDALRMRGGRIDLDAVRAVEAPLQQVNVALLDLRAVVDGVDSPWLIRSVKDELVELDEDFAKNEPRLRNAIDAVQLAPGILGDGGTRRYMMLFTSPAEARGLGGFVGSYAVIEVADGGVRVTALGRTTELNEATAGADCSACPEEMLVAYGGFGFTTGPNGSVGQVVYSNVTMPAHFPYIAEAVATLYPQAFGQPLDGVIVADPYTLQALMQYSGPIEVPALDTVVAPDDAAEFILSDQYVLAETRGIRVEALDTLGSGAIAAILSADLPDPPTIARDLGPLIAERRLLMWTADPVEQLLFDRIGLLGSIPRLDPVDGGFSVTVTNASGNKIDVFLERAVDVRIEESATGRVLVADVTLRNDAPTGGFPPYVIGNVIGRPDGFSRLYVTFYGPPALLSATMDGEPFALGALPEAGWMGFANYVDFAAGQERTFELRFQLPAVGADENVAGNPSLWEQPIASRP